MRNPPLSPADALYVAAKRRVQALTGPKRMSRTTRVVLTMLRDNPGMYCSALARAAGLDQGNVCGQTLPMLARYGLVESELGEPERRGGRTPIEWYLTGDGKQVAQAIVDEA